MRPVSTLRYHVPAQLTTGVVEIQYTLYDLIVDPAQIVNAQYVRFFVFFRSDAVTRRSPAMEELRLPYSLVGED